MERIIYSIKHLNIRNDFNENFEEFLSNMFIILNAMEYSQILEYSHVTTCLMRNTFMGPNLC